MLWTSIDFMTDEGNGPFVEVGILSLSERGKYAKGRIHSAGDKPAIQEGNQPPPLARSEKEIPPASWSSAGPQGTTSLRFLSKSIPDLFIKDSQVLLEGR